MKPWFNIVTPHADIREGKLDESVFAADLSEVVSGIGRDVYIDPQMFFRKTFITAGITDIARRVINGLNGGADSQNRIISLQTGFGGGKTHSLISLYHIVKLGAGIRTNAVTREILSGLPEPKFKNASVAVFTNKTNDPTQGRVVDGITIRTLWGEIAYQLGGIDAYEKIRENDISRSAPKGRFTEILKATAPALILIDELADYCVAASAITLGSSNLADQTISFVQELTEAVSSADNCVLMATLPMSVNELASSDNSAKILSALENRISRLGASIRPVEDEEVFEVVRRRLFEDLGSESEREQVITAYETLYGNSQFDLPSFASGIEYSKKLRKAYPFHPELLDMFRLRWSSIPYFQRTRGVLRILASVIADIWSRKNAVSGKNLMIHTSDVNLQNLDSLRGEITRLNGTAWDSVVMADVSGTSSNSYRIDNAPPKPDRNAIAQGIAVTVLLGSFGTQNATKGLSVPEIKLCMLAPDSFNHNEINTALDKLESSAHYFYYATSGEKRYWFFTKPNVNIIIITGGGSIKLEDIDAEIVTLLKQELSGIAGWKCLINPSNDIPEQQAPTLIFLDPAQRANGENLSKETRELITRIATKKGNTERIYRNTLLFVLCDSSALTSLQNSLREYLACKKVKQDYASQLDADQTKDLQRRMDEAESKSLRALVSAYSVIIKHSAGNLDTLWLKEYAPSMKLQVEKTLKELLRNEEWLLDAIGQGTLRKYNLLPTDSNPVKVKTLYETFLRFDDKPMISGHLAVQNSLLKFCKEGIFAIAAGEPGNFKQYYYKELVPHFDVTTDIYYLSIPESIPAPAPPESIYQPTPGTPNDSGWQETPTGAAPTVPVGDQPAVSPVKSFTVSGNVTLDHYTQLFQSFIMPFRANQHKIDVEVAITIKVNPQFPLHTDSPAIKSAQESAKQLGMEFKSV